MLIVASQYIFKNVMVIKKLNIFPKSVMNIALTIEMMRTLLLHL